MEDIVYFLIFIIVVLLLFSLSSGFEKLRRGSDDE